MRRKLVVGNWKMNGRIAQNQALLEALKIGVKDLKHADFVVCVPYPYFSQAQSLLQGSNVAWGAQNLCANENVALTGAVSAYMLTDYGCRYVIVGHSERRIQFHETDDTAATRFDAAEKAGLIPIFCMGESADERESDWTEYVVGRQLDSIIRRYGADVL
ncbi:MAG: triose-phosphate isomerase, partial [Candidatus Nitrotoga sp.]